MLRPPPLLEFGQHPARVVLNQAFDIGVARLEWGARTQAARVDLQAEGTAFGRTAYGVSDHLPAEADLVRFFKGLA